METLLAYNGTNYEASLGDGRTLFVDGGAWAEAGLRRARAYLQEKHPDLDQEQIIELSVATGDEEVDECFDNAHRELLDVDEWIDHAVEVDRHGEPIRDGDPSRSDAWIRVLGSHPNV